MHYITLTNLLVSTNLTLQIHGLHTQHLLSTKTDDVTPGKGKTNCIIGRVHSMCLNVNKSLIEAVLYNFSKYIPGVFFLHVTRALSVPSVQSFPR